MNSQYPSNIYANKQMVDSENWSVTKTPYRKWSIYEEKTTNTQKTNHSYVILIKLSSIIVSWTST